MKLSMIAIALGNIATLQNNLNCKVNADWLCRKDDWTAAIIAEGAEGLNWTDWCWWKPQEVNTAQARLEAIDCLHFAVSHALRTANDLELAVELEEFVTSIMLTAYVNQYGMNTMLCGHSHLQPKDAFKNLVGVAADGHPEVIMNAVFQVMRSLDMSFEDIYFGYIGKNVLNTFRKANGYKTGEYVKAWPIQTETGGFLGEDNDYMIGVLMPRHAAETDLTKLQSFLLADLNDYYQNKVKNLPQA